MDNDSTNHESDETGANSAPAPLAPETSKWNTNVQLPNYSYNNDHSPTQTQEVET